jgi:integrase
LGAGGYDREHRCGPLFDGNRCKWRVPATAGKLGSDLIFTRHDGVARGKSHQRRPMADACKRAKIIPPVSFHILRHTWASLAVMAGAPLMVVARNLGHADTRMVECHYGHFAPSYIADAIRAAAAKFGIEPDPKVAFDRGQGVASLRSG